MNRSAAQLRRDALQIWHAGLEAVRSDRLVRQSVRVERDTLTIGDDDIDLRSVRKIFVVGAGKAGAGMADGFEQALGPRILTEKQVAGWVNVPDDCVQPLERIHLHGARPAGLNEPTAAGVAGAAEIRRLLDTASPDDLCIALISGGASALLPDPIEGISLNDKLEITRFLSAAGANIEELNTVRKQLSRLKGGGLARACRADRLYALIISDVLGDPLDVIGSGLTVPSRSTLADAWGVLDRFHAPTTFSRDAIAERGNCAHIATSNLPSPQPGHRQQRHRRRRGRPRSRAIGLLARDDFRNALGRSRGTDRPRTCRHGRAYEPRDRSRLPDQRRRAGGQARPAERRGRGGRNQQLVLAAMQHLSGLPQSIDNGFVLLSAGTDGEDGPTDAAGTFCDAAIMAEAKRRNLDLADYLARNDAYTLFDQLDALIRTGPTHTNVCDLRVIVVGSLREP